MQPLHVALAALAVHRVTHLLHADGDPAAPPRPWRVRGDGALARVVRRFDCVSLWVAAPAALLLDGDWRERLLAWLALSGAAILLERVARARDVPPATASPRSPESSHGMLHKFSLDDAPRRPAPPPGDALARSASSVGDLRLHG